MMNPSAHAALTEPQRQALRWLSRLRDDGNNVQERQAFENWLAESPEHAEVEVVEGEVALSHDGGRIQTGKICGRNWFSCPWPLNGSLVPHVILTPHPSIPLP